MESELKVDTYRLAVLPLAYLGEQPDPFDCCRAEKAIDECYRDVFSTAIRLYGLYQYMLLVRKTLGDRTANAMWVRQQMILSGGVPEACEALGSAFDLIRRASSYSSYGYLRPAIDGGVADVPVELNVALTLLLHLPESPAYAGSATDRAEQIGHLQADTGRRLASCLLRSRDEIVTIFSSTFSYAGSVLQ